MRITVDTNVLVSATFWNGNSHKIIEGIEQKQFVLVLSKNILQEYSEVLEYDEIREKIRDKNLDMKYTLHKIISLATIVEPTAILHIIQDDPDDNKVLECALEGSVDYIVTQDNHLLKLKNFQGIIIMTPEDFLKLV